MKEILESVIAGDVEKVKSLVKKSLDDGVRPDQIISEGLIKAMDIVGSRMKSGEMYVPEVLIAAEAMKGGLSLVKPLLGDESSYAAGRVVIGTVAGDLHDIGKNLVVMLLESSGFEVIDLGVDVSTEDFAKALEEHKPQLVGLSALLTTTMAAMEETVKAINEKAPQVKTMIGGAPVSQQFADEIGAGGYAPDGAAAVDLAKQLLGA
ncbi:MAG TPA: cobalamin-binding protein [Firmicutes bacterium]|jgi:5-methyltetrahydrofolate--homocysteine methyltransferase|nr:cobalamin-binding protein [Bacillota bacterium]